MLASPFVARSVPGRRIAGAGLVAHGLAHTAAGTWAATAAPVVIVTVLWSLAAVGFVALGFVVWEGRRWDRRCTRLGVASAVASAMLLGLAWHPVFLVGLLLDSAVFVRLVSHPAVAPYQVVGSPDGRPPLRARLFAGLRLAFLGYLALVLVSRPWHNRWGTTPDERREMLPGDQLVPGARYRIDHAVTIRAPASAVWPWLLQLGQDRAGFYSYDWLERLVGDDVHNADRIVPAWQQRAVGDLVRATQPDYLGGILGRDLGWRVSEILPERALVLERWGAFVILTADDGTSRLYVRSRGPGVPSLATIPVAPIGLLLFEPIHFVMERAMLLGIRSRVERSS